MAFDCSDKGIGATPTFFKSRVLPTQVHAKKLFKSVESPYGETELLCLLSMGKTELFEKVTYQGKSVDKLILELPEMRKQLSLVSKDKRKAFYAKYDLLRNMQRAQRGELWLIQSKANDFDNWVKFAATKEPLKHVEKLSRGNSIFKSYEYFKNQVEYLQDSVYLDGFVLVAIVALLVCAVIFKAYAYTLFPLFIMTAMPIIIRTILSGRAPVTNMYETVGFSAFSVALFALIGKLKKLNVEKYALYFSFLCYLLLVFGISLFNAEIEALRPVLRDNFWLSTHVVLIVFSYGVLSLSWMMSIINLLSPSARRSQQKKELVLNLVKIGSIFLILGVILGAVWADKAWGRFWAWDPKETWSLICIVIYMAVIHWNYKTRLSPYMTYILVCAAYASVIMAWFGVNYLIATGMHSYGFQDGKGVAFVSTLLIVKFLFIVKMYLSRKLYD
jgi:ABC-type transport system involved in cytochrome c biogenesis permease subunit